MENVEAPIAGSSSPPANSVDNEVKEEIVGDNAEPEHAFRIRVAEDGMRVFLECEETPASFPEFAQAVFDKLSELRVVTSLDVADLEKLVQGALEGGGGLGSVLLVEGVPVVPPVDGSIDWTEDFFSTTFVVDEETGKADYRRRTARVTVSEGQLLARLVPATPGKEGRDVFGKRIRTQKERLARIRIGGNIRHDKEGDAFYAATSGRIRWVNGLLDVDEVYTIQGSVGLESGDISHPGTLVVQGDVLEGAKIEVFGDVEVKGVIEPAQVQCGGDLLVHGGITGDKDHRIVVGGELHAKYVVDADIQAGGDVTVGKEILQSSIETRGAINTPHGRIVGGEVLALGGIDAGQVGSSGHVCTKLTAGEDYALRGLIVMREQQIKVLGKNSEKIHTAVSPLLRARDKLPPKKRQALAQLVEKMNDIDERAQELSNEMETIREESRSRAKPEILIRETVFPEARLRIWGEWLSIKEKFPGPIEPVVSEGRVVLRSSQGT